MKGSDKWGGMAQGKTAVSMVLVAAFLVMSAHAEQSDSSFGQSLVLNVYLDNAGKALITGYAEDVSGLAFLTDSQFRFENDSHQLYALTDRLTAKTGDLWTLSFDANGNFNDYRVTFYLPSETSLGEINASQGLGYLLSASNESLVADIQGYEVSNPLITIHYRQLLAANGSSLPPLPPAYPSEGAALVMLLIAAALLMAGFGLAVFLQRKRRGSMASPIADPIENRVEETIAASVPSSVALDPGAPCSPEDDDVLLSGASEEIIANETDRIEPTSSSPISNAAHIQAEDSQAVVAHSSASERDGDIADASHPPANGSTKKTIVVSSEMEAVMQTLTARERVVMSTLIEHGGRMTQADIRYETGTPKSSLTGILISLERRKLVSKKEWGRTNIIELSDWFLSKKEHS
ncbi:MAG: helix-turn-helix domain-containing protein [Methanothrix sp.]|nr:helix-turn-helix domain-containing protein [Methanothrix sp.]